MKESLNGFTGFKDNNTGFESAAEASRKLQEAIASGKFAHNDSASFSKSNANTVHHEALLDFENKRNFPIRNASLSLDASRFDLEYVDTINDADLRWAWIEVDLAAIRHNVSETRRYLKPRTRLMAVVKADAYGHGAVQSSKAMLGSGADCLGVATAQEGIELRKAGLTCEICLLEQPPFESIPALLAYHITPSLYEADFAIAYGEVADQHSVRAPYHIAINTGMNRIGVLYSEVVEFLHQISFHRALDLNGVFTHFATADSYETLDLELQTKRFHNALTSIHGAGYSTGLVHASNSAATYRFPELHFDMVRCGISLYGIHPCEATKSFLDIRPAMSVHSRIVDTRALAMSEGVSYGFTYRSTGSVKICTIPIGYADGLMRILSNNISFLVNGETVRQVGAICMDQCMFEVNLRNRNTLASEPQIGDEVIIVGRDGCHEISMDDLARVAQTIPYEIAIGFSQRLSKKYV